MRMTLGPLTRQQEYDVLRLAATRDEEGLEGWVSVKNSVISIHPSLKGRRLLETVLHEILHGENLDLNEKTVKRVAGGLATALTRRQGRIGRELVPMATELYRLMGVFDIASCVRIARRMLLALELLGVPAVKD